MNGTMLQAFSWYLDDDGTHWNRLAKLAPSLAYEGVTSVWFPPAYKGHGGASDVGYGVYDLYDLGEFDQKDSVRTKYGTKDEYLACVKAFHDAGIQTLGDVVFNHKMGGDELQSVMAQAVNPNDRDNISSEPQEIDAWTRFTFPGRKGRYSDFIWDWNCFHGTDWDEKSQQNGLWLFEGKHWDQAVQQSENGNFDYLMGNDIDVNYPPVREELLRWAEWYLDFASLDGLRLDALKHIDRSFFLGWLADLRRKVGREIFVVGEYWSGDVNELTSYLGEEQALSLFDVALHFKLHDASSALGNKDLSRLFENTLVAANPIHAVTFVENHDTQPGQELESFVEPWFKPAAYALILLRKDGYPCVFYGDLYGMPNCGNIPPVKELPLLMEIRRRLAYGAQHDYFDDPDVIGWTREGDPSVQQDPSIAGGVACILTDKDGGEKRMYVGKQHAGETWSAVIGEQGDVVIDDEGHAVFSAHDGRLSVYVSEDAATKLEHDRILRRIIRSI